MMVVANDTFTIDNVLGNGTDVNTTMTTAVPSSTFLATNTTTGATPTLAPASFNVTMNTTDDNDENMTTTTMVAPSLAPSPFMIVSATCSSNAACQALELTGDCCPTADNVMLQCCDTDSTVQLNCPANPLCAAAGLEGACCPTTIGTFLDCCAVVPDECGDTSNTTTTNNNETDTVVLQCEIMSVADYKALQQQGSSSIKMMAQQWQWLVVVAAGGWVIGTI
jgi:hypothetical protein